MSKKSVLVWLVLGLVLVFSMPAWEGSGRDISTLDNFLRFGSQFFPPDFSDAKELQLGLIETVQIAALATFLAGILSLSLALIGAPWMPWVAKTGVVSLLAGIRSVPSLVWAVLAVAITGPYPRAGVLALMIYSIGYLGKFLLDDFQNLDLQLLKTYRRWGLGRFLAFRFGFWPQLKRRYGAHCLWMFEYNIRSASIIGYVGAGGLGLRLHAYQEYGQWNRFCAVLIVILGIVLIFEALPRIYKKLA